MKGKGLCFKESLLRCLLRSTEIIRLQQRLQGSHSTGEMVKLEVFMPEIKLPTWKQCKITHNPHGPLISRPSVRRDRAITTPPVCLEDEEYEIKIWVKHEDALPRTESGVRRTQPVWHLVTWITLPGAIPFLPFLSSPSH